MNRFRKMLAATFAGVVAAVAFSFVAAPAQADARGNGSATRAEQARDQVETYGITECTEILANYAYRLTRLRIAACGVAAAGLPSPVSAIALCGGGLVLTGVNPLVASAACIAASG